MGLLSRKREAPAKPKPIEVGAGHTDLYLADYGTKKVPAIRVIREFLGLRLSDAKYLVDTVPAVIAPSLNATDAQRFKASLEEAGAVVELRAANMASSGLHLIR
jgi:ribosomal protein L7/L12